MNFVQCLPQQWHFLANIQGVKELRLRDGKGGKVNIDGNWFWLGNNRLHNSAANAFCPQDLCDTFIKTACNHSVFAYEKMLAQGYFTLDDGTRIGVCGVLANETFRKYTSLCVRTARYFACVGQTFCDNLLVVGPPGSGKTTYLRDLSARLSQQHNVVVVDERGEISACNGFAERSQCDVLLYATKQYGFEVAVRTMSPDWIVCDELAEGDFPLIPKVTAAGVKLAASLHGADLADAQNRLGRHFSAFAHAVVLKRNTFEQSVFNLQNNGK